MLFALGSKTDHFPPDLNYLWLRFEYRECAVAHISWAMRNGRYYLSMTEARSIGSDKTWKVVVHEDLPSRLGSHRYSQ